jgi:hypothetical protein
MFPVYESLLTYIKVSTTRPLLLPSSLLARVQSAVTRNYSEKSLNSILDYISTADDVRLAQVAVMTVT